MSSIQPTRDQILDYLSTRAHASAAEMATALGVTAANIRHHLGTLQAKGLVCAEASHKAAGRGRPAKLYRLTPAAQQVYLEPLTRALLEALRRRDDAEGVNQRLCDVLCGDVSPVSHHSLRERLQHAMQRLETLHFKPRWEAHHDGPRVVFRRCPYASLVADFPELCGLDVLMLERMLGAKVERRSKASPPCEFVVHW